MSRLAVRPDDDRVALADIIIPNATLERFLGALQYGRCGMEVRGVKPMIDSCFGVIWISAGIGDLAPIISVAKIQIIIVRGHARWQLSRRDRGDNTKGSGLVELGAISVPIGKDPFQPARSAA